MQENIPLSTNPKSNSTRIQEPTSVQQLPVTTAGDNHRKIRAESKNFRKRKAKEQKPVYAIKVEYNTIGRWVGNPGVGGTAGGGKGILKLAGNFDANQSGVDLY